MPKLKPRRRGCPPKPPTSRVLSYHIYGMTEQARASYAPSPPVPPAPPPPPPVVVDGWVSKRLFETPDGETACVRIGTKVVLSDGTIVTFNFRHQTVGVNGQPGISFAEFARSYGKRFVTEAFNGHVLAMLK